MFKCLLLLADSVSFGKQIIYSLPEYIATPKFLDVGSLPQKFRRNPVLELLNRFLASYDYFGDFDNKKIYADYGQQAFINCFSGSAKYPQLCITINEQTFIGKTIIFKKEENVKNVLNSINVIGIIESLQFLQSAKYQINFFARILQTKQLESKLISKQIGLYDTRHSQFCQGIKELITKYHRPNEQDYWYQIQSQVLQNIRDLNKKGVGDIEVVQLLKRFWSAANMAKQFHDQQFHTHTGLLLSKQNQQQLFHRYLHKSLLFSKTRIKQTLGSFYTKQRARLVEKHLHSTKSFAEMMKQNEIDKKELQDLLSILLTNNLAVFINPIKKSSKYISCLRDNLKATKIKEFQDLFSLPFVQTLKTFEVERSSGNSVHFNQLKFLLINGLIKDLNIYIYDKECEQKFQQQDDKELYGLLKTYSYSGICIEQIASENFQRLDTAKIRGFLSRNPSHLGFYYVQSD